MSTHEPPGIPAFADSLAKLEAQIAEADAAGNDVPPEAREMAKKLRELVDALGALTSTLPSAHLAEPPAGGDKHAV
jgi:hypothetical protein